VIHVSLPAGILKRCLQHLRALLARLQFAFDLGESAIIARVRTASSVTTEPARSTFPRSSTWRCNASPQSLAALRAPLAVRLKSSMVPSSRPIRMESASPFLS